MVKKLADMIIGLALLHNRNKEQEQIQAAKEIRRNNAKENLELKLRIIEERRKLLEEQRLNEINPNLHIKVL